MADLADFTTEELIQELTTRHDACIVALLINRTADVSVSAYHINGDLYVCAGMANSIGIKCHNRIFSKSNRRRGD